MTMIVDQAADDTARAIAKESAGNKCQYSTQNSAVV